MNSGAMDGGTDFLYVGGANGNVGINTTSPGFKLDVNTSTNGDGVRIGAGVTSAESSANIVIRPSSASPAQRNWLISAFYDQVGGLSIRNSNAALGDPYSAGTTRLLIDQSGYLGIGTTTPAAPLHASGGTGMAGGWNRTSLLEATYPVQVFNSSNSRWGGIGYDYSTGLNFWVNATSNNVSSTGTSALTLVNSGNVGIGTLSPARKLEVVSGTNDPFFFNTASVIATAGETVLSNTLHRFLPALRYTEYPWSPGNHDGSHYTLWSTGVEWRTEVLNAAGTAVISATEQDWTQRAAVSWPTYQQEQPANDNRVNQSRNYLETGAMAKVDTLYDQFNNPTEVKEYDFDQTLKRRSVTTYSATELVNGTNYAADSIHLLRLPLQQSIYDGPGPETEQARTVYEYDIYAVDGHHNILTPYSPITGHDTTNYGAGYTTRGNVTRIANWIKSSNTYLYSYPRYDIVGNVVSTKDARGLETFVSFADDFGSGASPGNGSLGSYGATYAFPTLVTSPPPNPGEQPHTARSQYDFSTGLLTGFKDRNGIITQTIYNDPFNRPTLVKNALGVSGVESHAALYYAPTTAFGIALSKNDVLTTKDLSSLDDAALRSWTRTDGFGRTIESWSKDPQGDVKVSTVYDAVGRTSQVSNPYRPSVGEVAIFTTTSYDLAGRVTTVQTPDTATVTTSYDGNTVTVFDQMGKQRKSVTDALGRLVKVYEAPNTQNYLTDYTYDVLDNLRGVSQYDSVSQVTQTRTFDYDSLKRLTSATNPESGTVTYQYDEGGNLRVKTDARGVSSHYEYDGLNRLIRRWYNSDPAVTATTNNVPALPSYVGASDQVKYLYDSQTLPSGAPPNFVPAFSQGRSIAVIYGNGTAGDYYSYDEAGRIKTKIQQTGGVNYPISSLVYNLAGSVKSADYPSGRSVSYSYDTAGRTNTFSGYLGDATTNRTYSENISYSPFGGMTQEKLGTATPIYHKLFYNSRGQLAEIRAGLTANDTSWQRGAIINFYGICWGMCGGSNSTTAMPENNGNLRIQQIQIPNDDNAGYEGRATDFFQFFEYDQLNRLQFSNQVSNQENWRQEYKYDRYGNRTVRTEENLTYGLPDIKGFEIQTGTNRLYSPGDLALPDASRRMRYDDAGNLKHDTYTGQGSRTYDAENRMVTAQGGVGSALQYYSYDGDGRRVKRKVDNVETWQVYGIGGELIAEYAANAPYTTPLKEYGYRNGQLLVTATANSATWGPAPSYTGPNPLLTGHDIKLENLTELRTAVNSLRAHAGLAAYNFTVDPNPVRNETTVKADHIRQLRTALEQARTQLGLSIGGYEHPTLTENESLIYAKDFQELRDQITSAWSTGASGVDLRWMVTDQLGTPRMIFDQSGSLASTKRHDYLPFGEELFAGTGGRTTGMGYTAQGYAPGDDVRQKFTSYERDDEVGLDYAQARYYAFVQGRFTGVDPVGGSLKSPQSWNGYTYVRNNPTRFVDPSGMIDQDPQLRPCGPEGTPGCSPLGTLGITVTVRAPIEQIAITDVQMVTELQLRTGQADPIPRGYTASLLDAMANGNASGAVAGSAGVAVRYPPVAGGAGVAVGGAITAALLMDLTKSIVDAIARAIPNSPPPDPGVPLYRGVAKDHPGFPAALMGMAIPIGGHSDPKSHNAGNTNSIFTSWSLNPAIAARFAGPGGVVLFKNIERSRTVPSPNIFPDEQEVLVVGPVTGAQVRKLP